MLAFAFFFKALGACGECRQACTCVKTFVPQHRQGRAPLFRREILWGRRCAHVLRGQALGFTQLRGGRSSLLLRHCVVHVRVTNFDNPYSLHHTLPRTCHDSPRRGTIVYTTLKYIIGKYEHIRFTRTTPPPPRILASFLCKALLPNGVISKSLLVHI